MLPSSWWVRDVSIALCDHTSDRCRGFRFNPQSLSLPFCAWTCGTNLQCWNYWMVDHIIRPFPPPVDLFGRLLRNIANTKYKPRWETCWFLLLKDFIRYLLVNNDMLLRDCTCVAGLAFCVWFPIQEVQGLCNLQWMAHFLIRKVTVNVPLVCWWDYCKTPNSTLLSIPAPL